MGRSVLKSRMNVLLTTLLICALLIPGGGFAWASDADVNPSVFGANARAQEPTVSTDGDVSIVDLPKDETTPSEVRANIDEIDNSSAVSDQVVLTDNPTTSSRETVVGVETSETSGEEVIAQMEESDLYDAVGYQYHYTVEGYSATPNDPYFNNNAYNWALKSTNEYGAAFDSVWPLLSTAASPTSVSVAVIDTGIFLNHEDTGVNVVAGYDFGEKKSGCQPLATAKSSINRYHGTFVTSIIAANTDNGLGVTGAAWDTKVIGYKVIDKTEDMPTDAIVNAINDAIKKKVTVINLSLGGYNNDTVLTAACVKARKAGIVVVAASGNSGSYSGGGPAAYPAASEGVLSVGSITASGARSSFSTYNEWLDLSAPGQSIAGSTLPVSSYSGGMGTSYAAPHVSAACALLKRLKPSLTAAQIEEIVLSSTADTSTGTGWDIKTGWGTLNMAAAYQKSQTTVIPATTLTVSKSSAQIKVGDSLTLKGAVTPSNSTSSVSWYSDNPAVATVSQSGVVKTLKKGTAVISVRTSSGLMKECVVTATNMPYTVFAGSTRIQTAVQISKGSFPSGAPAAVIASSSNFPDALSAAPLSASVGGPILLSEAGSIPTDVKTELKRLGTKTIYIVGGEGVVSKAAAKQLAAYGTVVRLGGKTRYETSRLIADQVVKREGAKSSVFLVSGENFPDALCASPFAALNKMPLLLTSSKGLDNNSSAFIANNKVRSVYIAGGTGVVSSTTASALTNRGIAVTRWGGANRYDTSAAVTKGGMTLWNPSPAVLGIASGENFPDALAGGASLGLASKKGVLLLTPTASLAAQTRTVARMTKSSIQRVEVYGGPGAVSTNTLSQLLVVF